MKTDILTLKDLQEEMNELLAMSEQEACSIYNVDEKSEAIQLLQEWIDEAAQDEEERAANSCEDLFPYSYNELSRWAGLIL